MQRYYKIKLCSLLVSSSFYQLSWSFSPPPIIYCISFKMMKLSSLLKGWRLNGRIPCHLQFGSGNIYSQLFFSDNVI